VSQYILHIDMDAFYASIHQRDNPDLKGKAIAVGSPDRRGVVATCSYEARRYGIRSAMSSYIAKQMCPSLIFVKPDRNKYVEANSMMREIFDSYSELVEFVSIDEAYIDVTHIVKSMDSAIQIGQTIKDKIKERIGITASVGISINKFLAKTASELNKPDGLTVIQESEIESFLATLPIENFRGIGKRSVNRIKNLGILDGQDLKRLSIQELESIFGSKRAGWFYNIARGLDDRPVNPESRDRKSISVSKTFDYDLFDDERAYIGLREIVDDICERMKRREISGKTITVKIRYNDFTNQTRSMTILTRFDTRKIMMKSILELLKADPLKKPVRLFGVNVSNLIDESWAIY